MSSNIQSILRKNLLPFIGEDNVLSLSEKVYVKYSSLEFGSSSSEKTNKTYLTSVFVPFEMYFKDKLILSSKSPRGVRIRSEDTLMDIRNSMLSDAFTMLFKSKKPIALAYNKDMLNIFKRIFPLVSTTASQVHFILEGALIKRLQMDAHAIAILTGLDGSFLPQYTAANYYRIYEDKDMFGILWSYETASEPIKIFEVFAAWHKQEDKYVPMEDYMQLRKRYLLSINLQQ